MQRISKILFIAIFLLAAFFRLYGLNWDQGQHLHPDERFLTMVANGISWPKDISEYLDTQISPLNPHNRGFGFFVYGTFPLFFTKWIAEALGQGDYGSLTLVGRQLSALVDLGTVLLVFLIGKQITTKKIGVFAAFLYSIMVLPIQLSHFYAVDTYLTFFITLSFFLVIKLIQNRKSTTILYSIGVLIGASFGLAVASKISAILFLPIIGLGFLILLIKHKNLKFFFVFCSLFFVSAYLTFRLAQPYAFANGNIFDITLNPKILDNWKQLEGFMKPDSGFPPSVQWFGIKPFLFPFASLVLWGLGLPLGIIVTSAIIFILYAFINSCIRVFKKRQLSIINYQLSIFLSLFWTLFLFIYQSFQPAPTIRYYLPIYPFLAILSGYFVVQIFNKFKNGLLEYWSIGVLVLLLLIYPLSFLSIYSHPHSRVAASEWIYQNIPYGKTLASEHWDDGLPLTLDGRRISQLYKYVSLPLYDPDKPEKWPKIAKFLDESDYIVLSSNRLWGSITKAPKLFPQTSRYYKLLFDGSLGFEKIAEIASFPSIFFPFGNNCLYIMPPEEYYLKLKSDKGGFVRWDRCNLYEGTTYQGIVIRDELAEETFTVYDHPKVIIFKKIKPADYFNIIYEK